jgi:hypothetical protein
MTGQQILGLLIMGFFGLITGVLGYAIGRLHEKGKRGE